MGKKDDELMRLKKLAESFTSMDDLTRSINNSYSQMESKFEDVNARLSHVNELLRQSLAERNRLNHYLNNILESLTSGVIVTDHVGLITVFNSAAEKLTGISAESALGKKYSEIFESECSHMIQDVLNGKKDNVSGEKSFKSSEGKLTPAAYSITRLRKDNNIEQTGIVEILYDITEIKALEDNLKRISTLAALGEMAATVAHEIRNPVAGIAGFTALLMKDLANDPDKLRLVEKISRGVGSLNAIVGNLLDYTRTVSLNKTNVDPESIIEETIHDLKTDVKLENHKIKIEKGSKKLHISADPFLFRQIVFNLIKNALQASPNGGRIWITMDGSSSNGFTLSISDDGPGIPDNIGQKLFTPFYTTKTNGTGLGLATVKKLTELHGGKVSFKNRPGGGAVFTVEIPDVMEGKTNES